MSLFHTRLFAALSIALATVLAAAVGWGPALLAFLCCTLLSLSPGVGYRLGAVTLSGGPGYTPSEQFLQWLQSNYGSANFSQWQSVRKQFYSYLNYPQAGANQLNFFGYALSGAAGQNQQYTNMPKAGSFGQQFFLLKSIQCAYYVKTSVNLFAAPGSAHVFLDANNPSADFTCGLFQAGHFLLTIGAKPYVEFPKPFLYAPPADGEGSSVVSAVGGDYALAELAVPSFQSAVAYGELNRNSNSRYLVDPNILFEAEQQFAVTIDYPTGLVPIIATNVLTTNLYVGVILDGILFRPVQ